MIEITDPLRAMETWTPIANIDGARLYMRAAGPGFGGRTLPLGAYQEEVSVEYAHLYWPGGYRVIHLTTAEHAVVKDAVRRAK